MLVIEKRVKDSNVIQRIRNESGHLCEYIDPVTGGRCNKEAPGEPHHIRTRGAGGSDIRENLIQLCGEHHQMFHDGNLDRHHLIEIVAKREGKTVEEIYDMLKLPMPDKAEEIKPMEERPPIEQLIQAYIQLEEQEQGCRWAKGQLLDAVLNTGTKVTWLSSQIGISTAQIRELVKVYRAFPNEGMRIPGLSWYHHRVAVNSSAPEKYLAIANDEGLSTREMRKKILEDEGKLDTAQSEEDKDQNEAKKLLEKVEKFIAKGGESAHWLREQLQAIFVR